MRVGRATCSLVCQRSFDAVYRCPDPAAILTNDLTDEWVTALDWYVGGWLMVMAMLPSASALLLDRRPHVYMLGWSLPTLPKAEGSK